MPFDDESSLFFLSLSLFFSPFPSALRSEEAQVCSLSQEARQGFAPED